MAKVFCKKYKKELDALPFPPIPGEKGMNIMQNFSKEAWDACMLQEHGGNWPELFMRWMHRLLGENEDGVANAFSVFVQNETRRCFDGVSALRVP